MTDLQEDRSMLRNLLALGVDVYAVDWAFDYPQFLALPSVNRRTILLTSLHAHTTGREEWLSDSTRKLLLIRRFNPAMPGWMRKLGEAGFAMNALPRDSG
jgi:hypothetical protein